MPRIIFSTFWTIFKATNITWLAKKQFLVAYEDNEKQPVITYVEINTDKVLAKTSSRQISYHIITERFLFNKKGDSTRNL